MSRHRIVRGMDYSDDYDGYDDVYGHSVDDDSCISPTDAQQWLYDRARGQQSMSSFIRNNQNIAEEDEDCEDDKDDNFLGNDSREEDNFRMPELNDLDSAKLVSCIDEVRSVVGDSVSERRIVETSMRFDYNITKILDDILNEECSSSKSTSPVVSKNSHPKPLELKTVSTKKNVPKIITPDDEAKPSIGATVTSIQPNTGVKRGFDLSTPSTPSVSGRNTPVDTMDDSMRNTSLSANNNASFKVSKEQSQRNAKQLYNKERENQKSNLHMIVIGHVDAGKSTLMGHLLFDTGYVPQRVMHKHEQESKKLGKQSFMYAWVLDETGEERARGITMDVGQSCIETETKIVTLLDAPGHKDFIPNMISGATQADVALLVVDATRGEFETGFELGGQTREHALLVRSLGVNQLGVVVNKLDTVNWSEERFKEIVNKLKSFLKSAGFKESDVTYTPCSGLTGENLAKAATAPELLAWYKGPSLLSVINDFKVPARSIDRPFRMSVSDVYKGSGAGLCIAGRIETGVLVANDKVLVGASREQAQVKSIQINELPYPNAFAGDQVSVTLTNIDPTIITVGCILCEPQNPVPVATRFQARILVFNVKVPITIGFPVLFHHQSLIEPAVISKLYAQLHKGTGETIKKRPRFLGNNSCALVEIEMSKPICIERYSNYKELGRFMLRVAGVTIAAGMVTKIR